jgi:hypothetical protein
MATKMYQVSEQDIQQLSELISLRNELKAFRQSNPQVIMRVDSTPFVLKPHQVSATLKTLIDCCNDEIADLESKAVASAPDAP